MKLPLSLVLGALFFSCSLDYGEKEAAQMGQSVPNVLLLNVKQTSFFENKIHHRVAAELAEFFDTKQEIRLSRASGEEYDQDGKTLTEGKAELSTLRTDTNDASVNGGVTIYSAREQTKFYAESLNWVQNDRILKSTGESPVTIERDSGSSFEGRGFEMNFKNGTLNFSLGVKGTMKEETKK